MSGMHFVPGPEKCKLCICENGQAKVGVDIKFWIETFQKLFFQNCRAVACTPPPDCKSFQMGTSCCEFLCLDVTEATPSSISSYFPHVDRTWLIILGTATTPLLIIICCLARCCYRKHRQANRENETAEQDSLERDGLVHFNAFLKICDKSGKKLGAGDIGEIYMKFEFGFLRCYNDLPEAMRNTMDDEGYYRTGDIGYMKKGIVYILDKNRYISDRRNSNVSSSKFFIHLKDYELF